MASYMQDNGKVGVEFTKHTPTGYECVAKHPGNDAGYNQRIMFFARHVVGGDGHPYTEVGLTGLSQEEHHLTLSEIKESLKQATFREVSCLSEEPNEDCIFAEHNLPSPDTVAIRVNAGKNGISIVMDILSKMVLESSCKFVKEQEEVEDVLFESILHHMGDDLDKGPGGHEAAIQRAQTLAKQFEEGFLVQASSSTVII